MLNSLKQTSKDFLRLLLETANMRVQRLASPRNPPDFLCRRTGDPRRWLCTHLAFGTEKGFAAIIDLSKRE